MRLVIALGGNALMRRGQRADAAVQLHNLSTAVPALAKLATEHDIVLTHGNGPQVGLLALESAADPELSAPYPLDTLGAETQGMIGYWLVRELHNALAGREVVALVTQTVIAWDDPAFAAPTKFVGPIYGREQALRLAAVRGWQVRADGATWRRVVASPEPREIVELPVIARLVHQGVVVVAGGGGGVPVIRGDDGRLRGCEAVVDKDLAAALLATALQADMLVLLTDVSAVFDGFGTPDARPIPSATPDMLRRMRFAAGSMGPKVEAACRFVTATGGRAAIGALEDAEALAAGKAGTTVAPLRRSTYVIALDARRANIERPPQNPGLHPLSSPSSRSLVFPVNQDGHLHPNGNRPE
jgi:carbamate kinase